MASRFSLSRGTLLCLMFCFVSFCQPKYVPRQRSRKSSGVFDNDVLTYSKVYRAGDATEPKKTDKLRVEMHQNEPLYDPGNSLQCSVENSARFDCYPEFGANPSSCAARGCCWASTSTNKDTNVPYCFFPTNYNGYYLDQAKNTATGFTSRLLRPKSSQSGRPDDVYELKLDVAYETKTRLHFKVFLMGE